MANLTKNVEPKLIGRNVFVLTKWKNDIKNIHPASAM